jgi:ABC-type antimicrobial peptide transport system permease subunit
MADISIIQIGFFIGITFGLIIGFFIGLNIKSWKKLSSPDKKRHLMVIGIGGIMIVSGLIMNLWKYFLT